MPMNSHEIAIFGRLGHEDDDYLISCIFETRSGTFKSSIPKYQIAAET